MTGPSAIFFLLLLMFCSASVHTAVFGRKATKEANRFRGAWLECCERNPEIVTELAKLCKEITVCLDKQRKEALQMSWWTPPGSQGQTLKRNVWCFLVLKCGAEVGL